MYKNILAAVDGTPHGNAVLDAAASLAKLTGGKVHVVHIRPSQVISSPLTGGVVDIEGGEEGEQVLEQALSRLKAAGIEADGEVDRGLREDLAGILVDRAQELGSDLIAVGPGHYSGFSSLLHTSVSRGVAKSSPVSVLLVHSEA